MIYANCQPGFLRGAFDTLIFVRKSLLKKFTFLRMIGPEDVFKVYMRDCDLFVSMLEDGTQYDISQGNLYGYKGECTGRSKSVYREHEKHENICWHPLSSVISIAAKHYPEHICKKESCFAGFSGCGGSLII